MLKSPFRGRSIKYMYVCMYDSAPSHKVLGQTACVLRVVVLLEAMTIRKA